jgi:hypothetical protein
MKKVYYVYFTNGLYFDSFTRSQKIKLTKVVNESDIIQQYKENGNLCIQLDYNDKVKKIINNERGI